MLGFFLILVLGQTQSKLNNIKWQANLGSAGVGKSQIKSIYRIAFVTSLTRICQ